MGVDIAFQSIWEWGQFNIIMCTNVHFKDDVHGGEMALLYTIKSYTHNNNT